MKLLLTKTSNWEYREEIEINTIEEMVALRNSAGHPLILTEVYDSTKDEYVTGIEIYDDWRE